MINTDCRQVELGKLDCQKVHASLSVSLKHWKLGCSKLYVASVAVLTDLQLLTFTALRVDG